jgi:hypothetical protein
VCTNNHGARIITSVPASVHLEVHDADLESMRADFRRRHYGISRPWILVLGVAYVLLGFARAVRPHDFVDLWPLYFGLIFIGFSWFTDPNIPAVLRPTDLRFTHDGVDVDVAFEPPANRHYAWDTIRRIDDVGDALVVVPKLGKRLVLPKRAFPDHGLEARAFFAAHLKS